MTANSREAQIADAMALAERMRDLGFTKVEIEVTRGGTFKVRGDCPAGTVPPRHTYGTGRGNARTVQGEARAGDVG